MVQEWVKADDLRIEIFQGDNVKKIQEQVNEWLSKVARVYVCSITPPNGNPPSVMVTYTIKEPTPYIRHRI